MRHVACAKAYREIVRPAIRRVFFGRSLRRWLPMHCEFSNGCRELVPTRLASKKQSQPLRPHFSPMQTERLTRTSALTVKSPWPNHGVATSRAAQAGREAAQTRHQAHRQRIYEDHPQQVEKLSSLSKVERSVSVFFLNPGWVAEDFHRQRH